MIILRLLGPDLSLLVDRLHLGGIQASPDGSKPSLSCEVRQKPIRLDQSLLPLLNGEPYGCILAGQAREISIEGPRRQDRYPIRLEGNDLSVCVGTAWQPINRVSLEQVIGPSNLAYLLDRRSREARA